MAERPANYGQPWTWNEVVLAFDLYCRIPFQKTKASNVDVRALATLIERSPASVARKLGNLGAFDPELKRQNISGLGHGSKLDWNVWNEFHHDWPRLVELASQLRSQSGGDQVVDGENDDLPLPQGPSERSTQAKQRLHQSFFRQAVLSSYESTCCVTGLSITQCLTASHIIPWRKNEQLRADPTNGLCLSATYDRLFDVGLMAVTPKLRIFFCRSLVQDSAATTQALIRKYHKNTIARPKRFMPSSECLRWHFENVFIG